jgi:hypothetical protein
LKVGYCEGLVVGWAVGAFVLDAVGEAVGRLLSLAAALDEEVSEVPDDADGFGDGGFFTFSGLVVRASYGVAGSIQLASTIMDLFGSNMTAVSSRNRWGIMVRIVSVVGSSIG